MCVTEEEKKQCEQWSILRQTNSRLHKFDSPEMCSLICHHTVLISLTMKPKDNAQLWLVYTVKTTIKPNLCSTLESM